MARTGGDFYIYIFYLDVFIEQNFLMNLIILSLIFLLFKTKQPLRVGRFFCGAVCGTVLFLLFLIWVPGYVWAMFLFALFGVPAMLFVSYGFDRMRLFLRRILFGWFSLILLNGVAEAMENVTGFGSLTLFSGLLTFLLVWVTLTVIRRDIRMNVQTCPIHLQYQEKEISCMGFYDTGNRLTIPVTGEPVHIVCGSLLDQWKEEKLTPVMDIPFQALGTNEGKIPVVLLDQMRVQWDKGEICMNRVWCGVASPALFSGKTYQVILNAGVFER